MSELMIRELLASDREWLTGTLITHWNASVIACHGELVDASVLPGFIAELNAEKVGLLTYRIVGDECEIVTLNSFREGRGIGSRLIDTVAGAARKAGSKRLWLITTNDNVDAIRFYAKRGFRLVAVHLDALDTSRKLKPSIPETGEYGLPCQDEIEFEMKLDKTPKSASNTSATKLN